MDPEEEDDFGFVPDEGDLGFVADDEGPDVSQLNPSPPLRLTPGGGAAPGQHEEETSWLERAGQVGLALASPLPGATAATLANWGLQSSGLDTGALMDSFIPGREGSVGRAWDMARRALANPDQPPPELSDYLATLLPTRTEGRGISGVTNVTDEELDRLGGEGGGRGELWRGLSAISPLQRSSGEPLAGGRGAVPLDVRAYGPAAGAGFLGQVAEGGVNFLAGNQAEQAENARQLNEVFEQAPMAASLGGLAATAPLMGMLPPGAGPGGRVLANVGYGAGFGGGAGLAHSEGTTRGEVARDVVRDTAGGAALGGIGALGFEAIGAGLRGAGRLAPALRRRADQGAIAAAGQVGRPARDLQEARAVADIVREQREAGVLPARGSPRRLLDQARRVEARAPAAQAEVGDRLAEMHRVANEAGAGPGPVAAPEAQFGGAAADPAVWAPEPPPLPEAPQGPYRGRGWVAQARARGERVGLGGGDNLTAPDAPDLTVIDNPIGVEQTRPGIRAATAMADVAPPAQPAAPEPPVGLDETDPGQDVSWLRILLASERRGGALPPELIPAQNAGPMPPARDPVDVAIAAARSREAGAGTGAGGPAARRARAAPRPLQLPADASTTPTAAPEMAPPGSTDVARGVPDPMLAPSDPSLPWLGGDRGVGVTRPFNTAEIAEGSLERAGTTPEQGLPGFPTDPQQGLPDMPTAVSPPGLRGRAHRLSDISEQAFADLRNPRAPAGGATTPPNPDPAGWQRVADFTPEALGSSSLPRTPGVPAGQVDMVRFAARTRELRDRLAGDGREAVANAAAERMDRLLEGYLGDQVEHLPLASIERLRRSLRDMPGWAQDNPLRIGEGERRQLYGIVADEMARAYESAIPGGGAEYRGLMARYNNLRLAGRMAEGEIGVRGQRNPLQVGLLDVAAAAGGPAGLTTAAIGRRILARHGRAMGSVGADVLAEAFAAMGGQGRLWSATIQRALERGPAAGAAQVWRMMQEDPEFRSTYQEMTEQE